MMYRKYFRCLPGYTSQNGDPACTPCPSHGNAVAGSIGFTILLVSALAVLFAIIWRSDGRVLQEPSTRTLKARAFRPEDRAYPTFMYGDACLPFVAYC